MSVWMIDDLPVPLLRYQLLTASTWITSTGRASRPDKRPYLHEGDFCVWWGFFLIALAAGGWWTVISPLLMSFLLLKVSGVTMLEKTIKERRPAYVDYLQSTNAFFPGPRKAHH